MTDEDIIVADTWDESPEPAPVPDPEPAPAPEPIPEAEESIQAPDPEPEKPAAPSMEVVTVEELLDRLTGSQSGEEEDREEEPAEETDELPGFSLNPAIIDDGTIQVEVVDLDKVLKRLETIQGVTDHPALTTPFEDYTVTEGLLLLLFLSVFVLACVKLLKGGFSWLR